MLEKILLDSLFDDSFKKKIEFVSSSCLRSNSEKNKCQRCFDICPEQAITLEAKGVSIDSFLCTGCNFCISSCYSRSLASQKRPYLATVNAIVDGKTLKFGCMKTKDEGFINFGCLRAMDLRFLMALVFSNLEKEMVFDFSNCQVCQYGKLFSDLPTIIEGLKKEYKFKALKIIDREKLQEQTERDLSRRDFLKGIFKKTEEVTKSSILEGSRTLGLELETEEDIDVFIKILLKRGLENKSSFAFASDYIYRLEVDSSCTLCKECVIYCPSKALTLKRDKESEFLRVDLDLCTFCGRCFEKCKAKAIKKAELIALGSFELYKKKRFFCKSCKTSSTNLDENGLCPTCILRRKNRPRSIKRG